MSTPLAAPSTPKPISTPALALAGVAVDREFLLDQTMADAELARDVLNLFIDQCDDAARALQNPETVSDWRGFLHGLKGAARGVGARPLADLLAHVEARAARMSRRRAAGSLAAVLAATRADAARLARKLAA